MHDIWQDIVRGGTLKSVGMVGFAPYVSEQEAEAIRQYVLFEANRLYESQEGADRASPGLNQ